MLVSPQNIDDIFGIDNPMETLTPEEEYDKIAERLLYVNEQLENLKRVKTALEDKIWTLTPEDVGEFSLQGKDYAFTVKRTELWQWDSDVIQTKIVTAPLPDFVKAKYSIDKKKFKSLDDAEQQDFLCALTRKPSNPKISVSKKVSS